MKKAPVADELEPYRSKRDFQATLEPEGRVGSSGERLRFVVQKHAAQRLHYDFRLELAGRLLSWAVPKGPSLDPKQKRMAVEVEDHPLDYADFEGTIPAGHYGAGQVIVWDQGQWQPHGDPGTGHAEGKLKFRLFGRKLHGDWMLVRMRRRESKRQTAWLLIKEADEAARSQAQYDVTVAEPGSVKRRSASMPDPATERPAKPGTTASRAAPASPEKAGTQAPLKTRATTRGKTFATTGGTTRPTTVGKPLAAAGAQAGRAPLPNTLSPALATLVDAAPHGEHWRYEIKFDGYRLLARVENGAVRLVTRNGHDWTARLPALARAVLALGLDSAWLDGEIVMVGADGLPDFQALQNAFQGTGKALDTLRYYVFDLPFLDGLDLRKLPLRERRARLGACLAAAPAEGIVRLSEDLPGDGADVLEAACRLHLEGVIGKRSDSPYPRGRASTWIKLKCASRQEFVIGGYTAPQGSRTGLGALLLGYHEADAAGGKDGASGAGPTPAVRHSPALASGASSLRFAGKVGTGLDTRTLADLAQRLAPLERRSSPFCAATGERAVHWVAPELVCEVAFAGWTDGGRLRHAVFKGLREDKLASEVGREPHGVASGEARSARAVHAAAAPSPQGRPTASAALRTAPATLAQRTVQATSSAETSTAPGRRRQTAARQPADAPEVALRVSHAERVVDPGSGLTKGDVVAYYQSVATLMLPHLGRRPVALLRLPSGVGGAAFFQKHARARQWQHITQLPVSLDPGRKALFTIDSAAALAEVAQMNTVEIHTWNALAPSLEKPDRMVFDLDPGDGVAWPTVVQAAQIVRDLLDALGLVSHLKTSGGKGLHLVVPLLPRLGWPAVKGFSQALVQHLAAQAPDRFVAKSGPKNRVGRIFVDYLRNGRGATTVAAYSARARPGLPISLPLAWADLPRWEAGQPASIATPIDRLRASALAWSDYAGTRQTLTAGMKKLAVDPTKFV